MSGFVKINQFVLDLANGVHHLNTDAIQIMLTNALPNVATARVKADITEIATGSGYPAGGNAATFVSGAQAAGVYKLIVGQVAFVASGGSIGPFRYAVVYNATVTGGPLIGYFDYGTALTITDGNSLTVALDQVNGAVQVS